MDPEAPVVVTVGEAMVAFYPVEHAPLADAVSFASDIGGAELNVATSVARLGVPTAWVSRIGDDGFGERIVATAAAAGVDTRGVERDPVRPTGIYVKETAVDGGALRTRMHYYRRGSAASALSLAQFRTPAVAAVLRGARFVHTSGITAALSETAAAAAAGLGDAAGDAATFSVDLNFRPQLWRDRDPAELRSLVGRADLLFTGRDEAEAFFGHADPARLFVDHPRLRTLVVKDDILRASTYTRDGQETHVPCLRVEVVEPVGAGDAFAAGYLAALAEGRDEVSALRLGHAVAALTLVSRGDRPAEVPTAAERDVIAGASEEEWSTWSVRAGAVAWRRP